MDLAMNHISSSIMNRMRVFENASTAAEESTTSSIGREVMITGVGLRISNNGYKNEIGELEERISGGGGSNSSHTTTTTTTMMMSSPPPGVQTDADGLILPKKLINPNLESADRKQLHRELKFNYKVGRSVLNQKTELQRAYEKQRERQQLAHHDHQHQQFPSPTALGNISPGLTSGLKNELNRAIMERAQKHEANATIDLSPDKDADQKYVNPEYLNVRAKLRTGQRSELK